jgi:hypothetical protein
MKNPDAGPYLPEAREGKWGLYAICVSRYEDFEEEE